MWLIQQLSSRGECPEVVEFVSSMTAALTKFGQKIRLNCMYLGSLFSTLKKNLNIYYYTDKSI